jgi:oxygen-independent coproporphyrinogen-3 oxidase
MTDSGNGKNAPSALPTVAVEVSDTAYFGDRTQTLLPGDFSDALDKLSLTGALAQGLALHVHLPFCAVRCVSCDRVAVVAENPAIIDQYLTGLDEELHLITRRIGRGNRIAQLHVGGGTPNLLNAAQLSRLTALVEKHFLVDAKTETSLEIIPDRTSRTQLELIRGLGYRHVSFELREVDPEAQQGLGRSYSPELLQDAVANARAASFETVSIEIMYGLPGQTAASMKETILLVSGLEPDRIVTRPFVRKVQEFANQKVLDADFIPTIAEKMAMFVALSDGLEAAGYGWIGINAFAKPGDRLSRAQERGELRRNRLGYCTEPARWLIGIGLGAVSEMPTLVSRNQPNLNTWHGALEQRKHPSSVGVVLNKDDSKQRDGLNMLAVELSAPVACFTSPHAQQVISRLVDASYLKITDGVVAITPLGRINIQQVWNELASEVRWAHVA